jgi:integrase
MKLTKVNIAKITVDQGKAEKLVFDDDVPGFGLRVHAGGTAVWFFQYRIGTQQRRMKLGSAKAISALDARKSASQLHARVSLGQDPAAQKIEARTKAVETFGSILQPYLMRKKGEVKPRAYEEIERHLLKHAKPLHGSQLAAIDKRRAATLLTGLAATSGPNLANSVRASLSSFYGWAMREGLAEANPLIGTNKAAVSGSRDRVLADDELRSIWAALGNDPYGDILKLLALTGQRRDEIGSLRWSEVNFDKGMIELPAERTKNSRPHDVPLSDAALAVLKARPRLAGSEYVFTTGQNGFKGWSNYKTNLDGRIASKGAIAPWRLHDLRRTAATRMADIGVLPHIVEAVLNHVSGHKAGVAGVYNRAEYGEPKRVALQRWAERLASIVSGEPTKVVAISEARARR